MPAKKKASKAMQTWKERLAEHATAAAEAEANTGGGSYFSVQGGVLTYMDNPVPNNKLPVIILDSIFENIYYREDYVAGEAQPPTCFALNFKESELEPHESVVKVEQNQTTGMCEECDMNQWGSADTGRGKACNNTRRLAMIPAGSFDNNGNYTRFEDPQHFKTTPAAFLKLPVTSVKGYASFVKQLAGTLKLPPFAVVAELSVVPDPKTQYKVVFEAIEEVPENLMEIVFERHEGQHTQMETPYPLDLGEEEEAPKPRTRAARKKTASKKRTARRR